jgi:large subunit ribosomal protein L20
MPRVKPGKAVPTRKKKILKATKGFLWGRKSKFRLAKDAFRHAQVHAYTDRRRKKRDFRRLWQVKINAAARQNGLTYSQLIDKLSKAEIRINRKMLAKLAEEKPDSMAKIIDKVK